MVGTVRSMNSVLHFQLESRACPFTTLSGRWQQQVIDARLVKQVLREFDGATILVWTASVG